MAPIVEPFLPPRGVTKTDVPRIDRPYALRHSNQEVSGHDRTTAIGSPTPNPATVS